MSQFHHLICFHVFNKILFSEICKSLQSLSCLHLSCLHVWFVLSMIAKVSFRIVYPTPISKIYSGGGDLLSVTYINSDDR